MYIYLSAPSQSRAQFTTSLEVTLQAITSKKSFLNSEVHSCLHPNCHHEMFLSEFDLKVYHPPPYERLVWEYDKGKKDLIANTINAFDWDKMFSVRCVSDQLLFFNETFLNIMSSFIPDKDIVFDEGQLPWFYRKNKNLMITKIKIKIKQPNANQSKL